MKFAKLKPEIHAMIRKESEQTHRHFWAILDDLIRLGMKTRQQNGA